VKFHSIIRGGSFKTATKIEKKNYWYNQNMKKDREFRFKTAQTIIYKHILSKPQYSYLTKKRCVDKALEALPKHLLNGVEFHYIKNRTLFFALNHPGIKMEFNYNHKLIKMLLNKIKTIDNSCKDIEIDKIVSFISNRAKPEKSLFFWSAESSFNERAKGKFKIYVTDIKLKRRFENIKSLIKKRDG
jgi:hypothetical protein